MRYWVYREKGSSTYGFRKLPTMFWMHPSNRSLKTRLFVWLEEKGWYL